MLAEPRHFHLDRCAQLEKGIICLHFDTIADAGKLRHLRTIDTDRDFGTTPKLQ